MGPYALISFVVINPLTSSINKNRVIKWDWLDYGINRERERDSNGNQTYYVRIKKSLWHNLNNLWHALSPHNYIVAIWPIIKDPSPLINEMPLDLYHFIYMP